MTKAESLLQQVASALDFLHGQGIVHGCVCRSNVFWDEGRWELGVGGYAGQTAPPAADKPEGPADDIFALGLLVAGCLVAKFADTVPESIFGPADRSAPVSTVPLESLDDPLRTLLQRCLDAEPAVRPAAALLAQSPHPLPEGVHDVEVERRGAACRITWSPPSQGTVRWYRRPVSESVGELPLLLASDLDDRGASLADELATEVCVEVPEEGYDLLLPVTTNGVVAVAGKPVVVSSLEDTTLSDTGVDRGELVLRFCWPAGVHQAVVVLREDGFPAGPNDERAVRVPCARAVYRLRPFRYPIHYWEEVFLTVYSAENRGHSWAYSPGMSLEARCYLNVGRYRRICYRIRPRALPLLPSRNYELEIRTDTDAALPELILIGRPGRTIPQSRTDGEPLLILNEGYVCRPDATLKAMFEGLDRPFGVALFASDEKRDRWLQFDYCSKVIFT